MRIHKYWIWVYDDIIGVWFHFTEANKKVQEACAKVEEAHRQLQLIDAEELIPIEDKTQNSKMNKKVFSDITPERVMKKLNK